MADLIRKDMILDYLNKQLASVSPGNPSRGFAVQELLDYVECLEPERPVQEQTEKNLLEKLNMFRKYTAEMCSLYERKNKDYGDSFGKTFQAEGLAMARIRLTDKLNRFCTLTRSKEPRMIREESVIDTLLDLACYSIMTIIEIVKGRLFNDD